MLMTDDVLASPARPVLLELQAAGVRFRLEGDQVLVSPRGALTPEHRDLFRQHREAVRALVAISTDAGIVARRDVFAQQLAQTPAPTVPAFIFKPDVPYMQGTCFSCGDGLPELHFGRCGRCSIAWRLACRVPVPAELAAAFDTARVA